MEPQQVVSQFLQLPPEAQQIVADLIAYLDRREAQPRQLDSVAPSTVSAGATILPALDVSGVPGGSGENAFIDPDYKGGEADWDKPNFDFREWRRQIWKRPKAQI